MHQSFLKSKLAVILLVAALELGYELWGPNRLMKYVYMAMEGAIAHDEGEEAR